jgi:hypothetical protein
MQKTIDAATHEPLYTCSNCNTPIVPDAPDVWVKEYHYFCNVGCVYAYYDGELAAEDDDYLP